MRVCDRRHGRRGFDIVLDGGWWGVRRLDRVPLRTGGRAF